MSLIYTGAFKGITGAFKTGNIPSSFVGGTQWNALGSSGYTRSNDNLTVAYNDGQQNFGMISVEDSYSTGKYYYEITLDARTTAGDAIMMGICGSQFNGETNEIWRRNPSSLWFLNIGSPSQQRWINGNNRGSYQEANPTPADVFMIAVDLDNRHMWMGKNGSWAASATQTEIENGDSTHALTNGYSISAGAMKPAIGDSTSSSGTWQITANFGDTSFAHTVPSGFIPGWPKTV